MMRVIFLAAIGGVDDGVEGLKAGADDYLPKPFAISELAVPLSAISRRPRQAVEQTRLTVDDLDINWMRRTFFRAGQPINLLSKEFQLLEYFMRSKSAPSPGPCCWNMSGF